MRLNLDELEEFVKHYIENSGHIKDPKYMSGDRPGVSDDWIDIVWALDLYKKHQKKVIVVGTGQGMTAKVIADSFAKDRMAPIVLNPDNFPLPPLVDG